MELIYFISGILTVGVIYGTYLLINIKKSAREIMAHNTKTIKVFTRRIEDIDAEVSQVTSDLSRIKKEMSTDSYESITSIKEHLLKIDSSVESGKIKLIESNRLFNKNIVDLHNELSTFKRNMNTLQRDPNEIARYGNR
jgi:hypothetical protein